MNSTIGKHLLIEISTENKDLLNDQYQLVNIFHNYITKIGATIVTEGFKQFEPIGVSGFFLLAESHLSFHSWPDQGYVSIDVYTCGKCNPKLGLKQLAKDFDASFKIIMVKRGIKKRKSRYYSKVCFQKDLS